MCTRIASLLCIVHQRSHDHWCVFDIDERERDRERAIRDCVCMCECCISQILAQMFMCCSPIVLDNCFAHSTSRSIIDHPCRIRTRRGHATTTTCQMTVRSSPTRPPATSTGPAPFVAITALAHTTGRVRGRVGDALAHAWNARTSGSMVRRLRM